MRRRAIPINIKLPFLPGNKKAITIHPFIFWSKRHLGWQKKNVLAHELYHWNEQQQWRKTKKFGLLRWLGIYIWHWLWIIAIHGDPIQEHPMEKPAYDAETHS